MHKSMRCVPLLILTFSGTSWAGATRLHTDLPRGRGRGTRLQAQAAPAPPEKLPSIAHETAGFEKLAGYFTLYWDAHQGKLWIEIDKWSTEFLYVGSLPQGVGSNDVGLDRGQPGAADAHGVRPKETSLLVDMRRDSRRRECLTCGLGQGAVRNEAPLGRS